MVAVSKTILQAFPGVDLEVAIRYTPPDGELLSDLYFTASLVAPRLAEIPASQLVVDETGRIIATWEERVTAALAPSVTYEARIVRYAGASSRVLYIRKVQVR